MNTHPRLATILPAIAAEIDVERPMLSPLFATSIGVQIAEDTHTVWLHCADESTHSFLSIPTQIEGVRAAFANHGFRDYHINIHPVTWSDTSETSAPSDKPQKRTSNALTFLERQALQQWMQQPDNTYLVAHESDADAARQATKDLDPTHITVANIASMRKLLGIEKIKPEKPQSPQLPEGVTLASLQSWIDQHCDELAELRVEATGMKATIAELHDRLKTLITLKNYNADPACCIPPLSDLPVS